MQAIIAGVLRHVLTIAGGAGLFTDNDIAQIAGAFAALLGILLSALAKRQAAVS